MGLTPTTMLATDEDLPMITHSLWFWWLALALSIGTVPPPAAAQAPAQPQDPLQVSISGSGLATRTPNRAWIRLQVTTEAKTPPQAIDANAAEIKKLRDRLADKGLGPSSLQTTALVLRARYEVKREGTRETRGDLIGYVATKVGDVNVHGSTWSYGPQLSLRKWLSTSATNAGMPLPASDRVPIAGVI